MLFILHILLPLLHSHSFTSIIFSILVFISIMIRGITELTHRVIESYNAYTGPHVPKESSHQVSSQQLQCVCESSTKSFTAPTHSSWFTGYWLHNHIYYIRYWLGLCSGLQQLFIEDCTHFVRGPIKWQLAFSIRHARVSSSRKQCSHFVLLTKLQPVTSQHHVFSTVNAYMWCQRLFIKHLHLTSAQSAQEYGF